MIKNILVTGSSGTVGTALVQALDADNYNVTPLDIRPSIWDAKLNRRTKRCDLRKPLDNLRLKQKPDIIVTLGTTSTALAQKIVPDMQIVFTMVLGPDRSNITVPGVSLDIPFSLKLSYLKKTIPGLNSLGVIYSESSVSLFNEITTECEKSQIQLIGSRINSTKEFPKAMRNIIQKVDCFIMIADSMIYFPKVVEHLLLECLKQRVPVVGLSSPYTKAGALISFNCDYRDLGRQTGKLIVEILKEGSEEKRKAIIQPRSARVSINLLIAKRLDLKIAKELIREATQVFGK